jgi:hypothetical protein
MHIDDLKCLDNATKLIFRGKEFVWFSQASDVTEYVNVHIYDLQNILDILLPLRFWFMLKCNRSLLVPLSLTGFPSV